MNFTAKIAIAVSALAIVSVVSATQQAEARPFNEISTMSSATNVKGCTTTETYGTSQTIGNVVARDTVNLYGGPKGDMIVGTKSSDYTAKTIDNSSFKSVGDSAYNRVEVVNSVSIGN